MLIRTRLSPNSVALIAMYLCSKTIQNSTDSTHPGCRLGGFLFPRRPNSTLPSGARERGTGPSPPRKAAAGGRVPPPPPPSLAHEPSPQPAPQPPHQNGRPPTAASRELWAQGRARAPERGQRPKETRHKGAEESSDGQARTWAPLPSPGCYVGRGRLPAAPPLPVIPRLTWSPPPPALPPPAQQRTARGGARRAPAIEEVKEEEGRLLLPFAQGRLRTAGRAPEGPATPPPRPPASGGSPRPAAAARCP